MPIANCFVKKQRMSEETLQALANDWADEIGVDIKDICLTVVYDFLQAGKQYEVMVNLFLPSLWSKDDVKKIQGSLLSLFSRHLNIQHAEIFIITTIVPSGQVVENGEVVEW